MKILDLTAGNRAIWFNRRDPRVTFVDLRAEVGPDIVADSRALPPDVGDEYTLVVFDPPHENYGAKSNMAKSYGHYIRSEIVTLIEAGAHEAWRVTAPGALMAFKWNTCGFGLERAVSLLAPYWDPLFGHGVSHQQQRSRTYWMLLARNESPGEREE